MGVESGQAQTQRAGRGLTVMPKKILSPKVIVRRATAGDEKRWRELFDGYCLFY